jgi:hypothetical protein
MAADSCTVVVSCGYTRQPSGAADRQLRCRLNRGAVCVPAAWDDERQSLCCTVSTEVGGSVGCDLRLDARTPRERVLLLSGGGCLSGIAALSAANPTCLLLLCNGAGLHANYQTPAGLLSARF